MHGHARALPCPSRHAFCTPVLLTPALLAPCEPPPARWRPDRKELAEFLDLNILLYGRLQLPVTGILGPSYTKAAQAAVAASPVAGAASAVFSAGLDVSDT